MDPQLKQALDDQNTKIDAIYKSVEKTRKYMFWTGVATIAFFVLPLIAAAFLIPSIIGGYMQTLGGLGL